MKPSSHVPSGRPRLGSLVHDKRSGRDGKLMYIGDDEDPSTGRKKHNVAFLRPEQGGVEWTTAVDNVEPISGKGRSR
ncbi:hypothetical protein [Streptomyces sp. NPDC037389]|uniref:hypothetical protein n=1 Tax=Streptomyces sp. NPDC037389 TaxID=3155369 RepID=UPI0033E0F2CF